jgi:3-dehydroquinate dehydratase-2
MKVRTFGNDMKKILLLNGPNLSLLGKREPEIYGTTTLQDIVDAVKEAAAKKGVDVVDIQSDEEGVLVKAICDAREWADGIIINPAAYTHTSVAIHDAIKGSGLKAIEVHISNVYAREGYRHESLTAGVCAGQICGLGVRGYLLALEALVG